MKVSKTVSLEFDIAQLLDNQEGKASKLVDAALRALFADPQTLSEEHLRNWGAALEKRKFQLWNELQARREAKFP